MTPDKIIFAYVLLTLGVLALTSVYYEVRRKRFEPLPTRDHIFRCSKCGFVYTDDADVDRSRCPQCGVSNEFMSF